MVDINGKERALRDTHWMGNKPAFRLRRRGDLWEIAGVDAGSLFRITTRRVVGDHTLLILHKPTARVWIDRGEGSATSPAVYILAKAQSPDLDGSVVVQFLYTMEPGHHWKAAEHRLHQMLLDWKEG